MAIIIKSSQFLFLHFGTKSSTKQHQGNVFPSVAMTSLQVFPTVPAFSCTTLLQLFFGLPLLLCPWGFQFKTCFSMVEESFLIVRPIHFHFRSLIYAATRISCARLHSSSFEMMPGQRILKVFLRHLFTSVCRSFAILGAPSHALYPYRRTNVTLFSKILTFVAMDNFL